jgi:molybdopterin synthase catalytic subunit
VTDSIRLLEITDVPIDVGAVYAALGDRHAGGISIFVGTVRDHDHGQSVVGLDYSAHPTAEQVLREVVEKVVASYELDSVAAVHRIGALDIGDIAVVVAVASAHRNDAFAACRALIDDLKATVPIWKHQRFTDGSEEWVGTP